MVRFAKEKDIERVNELRKQVNDIHVEGRPDIFKPGFGTEIRDVAERFIQKENKDIIVAIRDDEICGMLCVEVVNKPESPYSKARSYYNVVEVAVDEKYRQQGVGRELFEFIKTDAARRGLDKIELDVWEFNESAIEFYKAVGFKETRRWFEFDVK